MGIKVELGCLSSAVLYLSNEEWSVNIVPASFLIILCLGVKVVISHRRRQQFKRVSARLDNFHACPLKLHLGDIIVNVEWLNEVFGPSHSHLRFNIPLLYRIPDFLRRLQKFVLSPHINVRTF